MPSKLSIRFFVIFLSALVVSGALLDARPAGAAERYRVIKNPVKSIIGHSDSVWINHVLTKRARVITASSDKTIKIWDILSGKKIMTMRGLRGVPTALAVNDAQTQLAVGNVAGDVAVWNLNHGKILYLFKGDGSVWIRSKDSKKGLVETKSRRKVKLDKNKKPIRVEHSTVGGLAFLEDGKSLAIGRNDGRIEIWDKLNKEKFFGGVANPEHIQTLEGITAGVTSMVKPGPGSKNLLAGYSNGSVYFWALSSIDKDKDKETIKAAVELFHLRGEISALSVAPDSQMIAAGSSRYWVGVYDRGLRKLLWKKRVHKKRVNTVAFARGNAIVLSGGGDKKIFISDATGGKKLSSTSMSDAVLSLSVYEDGAKVAASAGAKSRKEVSLHKVSAK